MISLRSGLRSPSAISGPIRGVVGACAATALADWLFFRHPPGISIAIFVIALCLAATLANAIRASCNQLIVACAVLVAAILPAIEDSGLLSFVFAIGGSAVSVLTAAGWAHRSAVQRLGDAAWLVVCGLFRISGDVGPLLRLARNAKMARRCARWLASWVVPVGLGGVFLFLFSQANPLVEAWLIAINGPQWSDLDARRLLFWLLVFTWVWPFMRVRIQARPTLRELWNPSGSPPPKDTGARPGPVVPGAFFDTVAIVRSLVLFNALFAIQTAMDITYLWGGFALPNGMSYAAYAHRGAYPLIVTALLAGAFVLAVTGRRTESERLPVVRVLVFLWIGQNVLLVVSSMLRLDLYVDAYSLTEWRCAAFIWMLLVAVGLILIVARIAFERSNGWLVWSNAGVLAATLYVCALTDFSGLIARFNVAHSQIQSVLDVDYLCRLGPAAIPALDTLVAERARDGRIVLGVWYDCRAKLVAQHQAAMHDWRAWTFRGYRLARYLEDQSRRVADGSTN